MEKIASYNKMQDKCIEFTAKIISLMNSIKGCSAKFAIENQLIRSAASIGANYTEGNGGVTKRDWLNYKNISRKSALETEYWLKVLEKSKLEFDKDLFRSSMFECLSLIRLFTSITKTGSIRYKK